MQEYYCQPIDSPVGPITILITRRGALAAIFFGAVTNFKQIGKLETNKYACGPVALQLGEYFAEQRRQFDLEIDFGGTAFQRDVWHRLQKIPFGETMTYGELANKIGRRTAVRAVANAVAGNPIPIVIPCHRILPKSGGIGNYSLRTLPADRGSKIKDYLLNKIETANLR